VLLVAVWLLVGFWCFLCCYWDIFSDAASECNFGAKASNMRKWHLERFPLSFCALYSALKENSNQPAVESAADEVAALLPCPWCCWAAESCCLRLSKWAGLVLVLGQEDCLWILRRLPQWSVPCQMRQDLLKTLSVFCGMALFWTARIEIV